MEYIYKNDAGEHLVLDFPIGDAPEKTKVDGVKFTRDFEAELQGKSFCLKGSGWPGQDSKRKTQMTANNKSAGKRTKDTWGEAKKAIPNYKGQETGTWEEAANLSSKDKE
jgi:hypothetical protein